MLTLPDVIIPLLQPFKVMFQARTWSKAQVLLIGAILATRKRTVTSALRVMGLSDDTSFARYHHVLNRAGWSPLRMAHCLLLLLIQHLDHGDGPLVFGIDETLERRRGRRIKAKGIYRDGVRSSASHFVKASGPALGEPDVAGAHTLGTSDMGAACADCPGALGAILPGDGSDSQKAHRLGASDDRPAPSLAASPHPGHRS